VTGIVEQRFKKPEQPQSGLLMDSRLRGNDTRVNLFVRERHGGGSVTRSLKPF